MEDANAFAEEFMADYNRRFARAPRHDFDVHRPLDTDDNLDAFFTWREPRRVSKSLTIQYDKALYLIEIRLTTQPMARLQCRTGTFQMVSLLSNVMSPDCMYSYIVAKF